MPYGLLIQVGGLPTRRAVRPCSHIAVAGSLALLFATTLLHYAQENELLWHWH